MSLGSLVKSHMTLTDLRWSLLVLMVALTAQPVNAQTPRPIEADAIEKLKVLDIFRGKWNVTVATIQPTTQGSPVSGDKAEYVA